MPPKQHYLFLGVIITLSAALRFTGLDSKPLWLDEIITTLFSLGQSFDRIPLDRLFSLEQLPDIFTFNPQVTCQTIADTVAGESTHPPVFFCLLHWWLGRMSQPATLQELVWYVRSLPAFFGVVTVAAIYILGRVAFSPNTGIVAAAFMAVSPFAVYLSQEARHYTLPLLLITLALITLIQIQQDIAHRQRVRPTIWIGWVIFNTIGLYIHYFFILALAAQIGAILLWHLWQCIQTAKKTESFQVLSIIRQLIPSIWHFAFCILPPILFLPWLPILLEHFNRPETEWFKPFEPSWVDNIVPIYQIILGWVLMAIALPVENQPLWIAIPSGIFMLGFGITLGRTIWQKLPKLFTSAALQDSSLILGIFTVLVLAEFLAIVYILGKDITSAVRYHFIYYPSICVLLAACFSSELKNNRSAESNQTNQPIKKDSASIADLFKIRDIRKWIPANAGMTTSIALFSKIRDIQKWISECAGMTTPFRIPDLLKTRGTILLGLVSSLFVVSGLVFQKPYNPEQVANHLILKNLEPQKPLMVIVGYESFQEVALGLGFAWEVDRQRNQSLLPPSDWIFVDRTEGYHTIWPTMQTLQTPMDDSFNLWIVAPGLRQKQYPPNLPLSASTCVLDPTQYYRIGIPYQLYRCVKTPA